MPETGDSESIQDLNPSTMEKVDRQSLQSFAVLSLFP